MNRNICCSIGKVQKQLETYERFHMKKEFTKLSSNTNVNWAQVKYQTVALLSHSQFEMKMLL